MNAVNQQHFDVSIINHGRDRHRYCAIFKSFENECVKAINTS